MRTGWNTAGTALDARTATPVSPTRKTMPWPLSRSVATMPSGMLHLLDAAPAGVLAHEARQRLAADQPAPGKGPVGDGALVHRLRQSRQISTTLARRVQRRHQAAGRGADDQVRPDAGLFEHLDHSDVGEAARRSATQRQADERRFRRRLGRWRRQHHRWSRAAAARSGSRSARPSNTALARRRRLGFIAGILGSATAFDRVHSRWVYAFNFSILLIYMDAP